MSVRAAVLREAGLPPPYARSRPLEVLELDLDPPGPGELLVRVGAAGLCHSDLSVIDGSRPRALPMVLGHEAAGEVIELGAGVNGVRPGDHVVLTFVPACGSCPPCRAGRPALCEPGAAANARGELLTGGRRWQLDGEHLHHHLGVSAFAEHVVVAAVSAVPVDPDVPFEVAALFGCAVLTGVGAVTRAGRCAPGERVAVFGLGGVGLAAVLGALQAGASQVIGVDRVSSKLELAQELGATATIDAGQDPVDAIRELTDGGAELVVETVGNEDVLAQAYAATRRGGTTVTVGLPAPSRMLAIPALSLTAEERTLRGSYLGSSDPKRDIPQLVDLYRRGGLPVDRLLSQRIGLDEVNAGFDRLARGDAVRQVVLFEGV
jgi:Zn-dependent alcohol dehydrogenase